MKIEYTKCKLKDLESGDYFIDLRCNENKVIERVEGFYKTFIHEHWVMYSHYFNMVEGNMKLKYYDMDIDVLKILVVYNKT